MTIWSVLFLFATSTVLGVSAAGNAPAINLLPPATVVLRAGQPEGIAGGLQYAVVIDAGSSGSRLHLYSWQARSFNIVDADDDEEIPPLPLAEPEEVKVSFAGTWCKKNKLTPGVSEGVDGVKQVKLLVECAQLVAPLKDIDIKRVPIFLFATGGMRLLSLQQRLKVFTDLESVLRKSGHRFDPSQSRILSGEEEGTFAWLAVNYRQGRLKSSMPHSLQDTVGIVEMGGASAQVAFKPRDANMLAGQYRVVLGNGIDENIYTHSHLYFGMNEALDRLLRVLGLVMLQAHEASGSSSRAVQNPCMPKGAVHSLDVIDERRLPVTIELRGSGSGEQCRNLLKELLAPEKSVCLTDPRTDPGELVEMHAASSDAALEVTVDDFLNHPIAPNPGGEVGGSSCVAGTVYQPEMQPRETMVVVGSLVFVWQYFGLDKEHDLDWEKIHRATDSACDETWDQAFAKRAEDEFATDRCFQGSYMTALFWALRFHPSQLIMAKEGYSWTLGAAVAAANKAPVVVQPVVTRIAPQVELDLMKAAWNEAADRSMKAGESSNLLLGAAIGLSIFCVILTLLLWRAQALLKLSHAELSGRAALAEVEMVP